MGAKLVVGQPPILPDLQQRQNGDDAAKCDVRRPKRAHIRVLEQERRQEQRGTDNERGHFMPAVETQDFKTRDNDEEHADQLGAGDGAGMARLSSHPWAQNDDYTQE